MSYQIRFVFSDVTQLAGYQAASENCPSWKAAKIEKKNKELIEKEKVSLIQFPISKRGNRAVHVSFRHLYLFSTAIGIQVCPLFNVAFQLPLLSYSSTHSGSACKVGFTTSKCGSIFSLSICGMTECLTVKLGC